jgi:hypothetical protein
MARQLVTQKATLRTAEFAAAESHLARLREGRPCAGAHPVAKRGGRTKKLQGPKSRPCLIFKHALTYVVGS